MKHRHYSVDLLSYDTILGKKRFTRMFSSRCQSLSLSLDAYTSHNAGDALLIGYAVVSCLLVGVHLLALLMSMCILPELKSVIRHSDVWLNHEKQEATYIIRSLHRDCMGCLDWSWFIFVYS